LFIIGCSGKIDTSFLFKKRNIEENTRFVKGSKISYIDYKNKNDYLKLKSEKSFLDIKSFVIECENITLIRKNKEENIKIKADKGIYLKNKNQVRLKGNILIDNGKGGILKTDKLLYDVKNGKIVSHSDFMYKNNNIVLRGKGFISDSNLSNVKILKAKGIKGE